MLARADMGRRSWRRAAWLFIGPLLAACSALLGVDDVAFQAPSQPSDAALEGSVDGGVGDAADDAVPIPCTPGQAGPLRGSFAASVANGFAQWDEPEKAFVADDVFARAF